MCLGSPDLESWLVLTQIYITRGNKKEQDAKIAMVNERTLEQKIYA